VDDDLDDYEATLHPFVRFIRRTEQRIRRCELQATLAEAKARVVASGPRQRARGAAGVRAKRLRQRAGVPDRAARVRDDGW
jgi:hypothetical protein